MPAVSDMAGSRGWEREQLRHPARGWVPRASGAGPHSTFRKFHSVASIQKQISHQNLISTPSHQTGDRVALTPPLSMEKSSWEASSGHPFTEYIHPVPPHLAHFPHLQAPHALGDPWCKRLR